jgi:pre-mRNA cleavage complex 2 protein Pcf11
MSVSVGQAASLPLSPSGDQMMADADPENDAAEAEMESEDDDEEEEEEDFGIEEEQLEEYKEILERMGNFADKVTVNSLSMVAEDHADSPSSAAAIYGCIRDPLLSPTVAAGRKLPLVYVMDSILKNVKGEYRKLIEEDAHEWMPVVHKALGEEQRAKLKRVWNTWREFRIFPEDKLERMGQCFVDAEQDARSARLVTEAKAKAAGMGRRVRIHYSLHPSFILYYINIPYRAVMYEVIYMQTILCVFPSYFVFFGLGWFLVTL